MPAVQVLWHDVVHCPVALHVPLLHVPQLPPHPSFPQVFPMQFGVQLPMQPHSPVVELSVHVPLAQTVPFTVHGAALLQRKPVLAPQAS